MLRFSVLAWVGLVLGLIVAVFHVKAQVEQYNRDLIRVNRQIAIEQERIRVLRTEWSLLDHPSRIAELARIHLGYDNSQRPQVAQLADLPAREDNRHEITSVLRINISDTPAHRLGPNLTAELLELDREIGGLRHISSPDVIGDLIGHLTSGPR